MDILFEDNHIIVVVKPPNVPSQSDKTDDLDMLTMIKQYIKEKYNKPGNVYLGLVHRLDRPVGGVMVFAKTSKSASRLSEQVRNKTFKKKYIAIVSGKFSNSSGIMQDYLWKDQKKNISYVVKQSKNQAKFAELEYKVLKYDKTKDLSYVEILLHTGRHHQIRVQFSSRMHALYGDSKYHGRGAGSGIRLWAKELTIIHPTLKTEMTFTAMPEWNELM